MAKGISIMSQLLSYINYSDEKDVNHDVAKTILENYHQIPKLTIYELADLSFVSASTITRFIRLLGFESYKAFKKEIDDVLKIDVDYSKNVNLATKADLLPIYQRYTENVIDNIRYTYENLDYEQLARVTNDIYEAKDIAFFGLEYANNLGVHFQNKMASLNKFIKIGVSDEKQLEIAKGLSEGSLVFIVSLEGSFFYRHSELFEILIEKKCKIIAITMLSFGKHINYCEEVIQCNKTNSNTEGRITLNYVIELIIMHYYINYSHL